MFTLGVLFMEILFQYVAFNKLFFDLPGTENCIDRMEHFEH